MATKEIELAALWRQRLAPNRNRLYNYNLRNRAYKVDDQHVDKENEDFWQFMKTYFERNIG